MKKIKLPLIDWLIIFGLLGLCYAVFFHHLDEFTIRLWDEGRNAVNAIEMMETKNPIVTYFGGRPDMWNTKPPLHIWIVVLFYKILGVNELALRLPSAISATMVVVMIYIFSVKILKSRAIGLLGSLIILSSMGFPDIHIGRTGDYDALLTLWVFLGSMAVFKYLEDWEGKWLYWGGSFFGLAVLTKGMAGLLVVPGIILYTLISGKFLRLMRTKDFWKTVVVWGVIIGGYYGGRELLNSGYLKTVWNEEIWGRTQKDLGTSGGDFWYYWKIMASFRFQKWILLVPVSIIAYVVTKSQVIKNYVIFAYILVISYFLIISKVETKQLWYDAQLYPLMSLLVAILLVEVIKKLPWILRLWPIVIICFYMQRYIRTNIAYINRPDIDRSSEACLKYGYLFRDKSIETEGFAGVHLAEWCTPIDFYLKKEKLERKEIGQIKQDDKILTCDWITNNKIIEQYDTQMIFDDKNGCLGYQIRGIKILN